MSAKVFPACAGMNRSVTGSQGKYSCVPRMRGDEPLTQTHAAAILPCSPHARG